MPIVMDLEGSLNRDVLLLNFVLKLNVSPSAGPHGSYRNSTLWPLDIESQSWALLKKELLRDFAEFPNVIGVGTLVVIELMPWRCHHDTILVFGI